MRWVGLLLAGLAATAILLWMAAPPGTQDPGPRQPERTVLGDAAADAEWVRERVETGSEPARQADATEHGATAALPCLAEEDLGQNAERIPPPPSAAPRADRHDALARTLVGADSAVLAEELRTWSEQHAASVQTALAEWRAATPADGRGRETSDAAFNQRMEELGAALELRFGRSQAARIALAGGLHRVDLTTGEIYAVDLDGRRLPARLDPSE